MEKLNKHIVNGGEPIIVRHRKVGTSYILTVPKLVEHLVKVTDEYQLEILDDGSLLYVPIDKKQQ